MMRPLPADAALDRYFLEVRAKLLDIAAALDRIDRGGKVSDPRLEKIHKALAVLQQAGPGRAEQLQQIFSLTYDQKWERPQPR